MAKEKKKSFREVTIQDVARLAGVSPTSVSNVLNGRFERMREETVERIQRAIKQLGYTPSLVARQLKTGYVPIIGLIVPSVANPFGGLLPAPPKRPHCDMVFASCYAIVSAIWRVSNRMLRICGLRGSGRLFLAHHRFP